MTNNLINCDCCNETVKRWQSYTLAEVLEEVHICDSCRDKLVDCLLEHLRELHKGERSYNEKQ